MIDKNTLKIFGFKKKIDISGTFSKKSYFNQKLNMWYDPLAHSNQQFADNVTSSIIWLTYDEVEKTKVSLLA